MKGTSMFRDRSRRRQRGQVIPITALAMIALIGGVALILELSLIHI